MKNDGFKAKLAALDALDAKLDPKTAAPGLAKALGDRSNFIVAKAAMIVAHGHLRELLPQLIGAFERLIDNVDDDAGCRGKNALAKALKDLDVHDPAPFLRGLAHHQLEPVWGGTTDTAGLLRATCAQALVACDIDPTTLLERLTDSFVDADKAVRMDVAIAIAQLGRPESALLLRLKALCGDAEPEVIGQCLLSLLDLAPVEAVAFVARFLRASDPRVGFEAVNALAQSRSPEAIEHIGAFWSGDVPFDLRRSTVAALTGSPLVQTADFLLKLIAYEDDHIAVDALTALAASRFRAAFRDRASAEVAKRQSETLDRAFQNSFTERYEPPLSLSPIDRPARDAKDSSAASETSA